MVRRLRFRPNQLQITINRSNHRLNTILGTLTKNYNINYGTPAHHYWIKENQMPRYCTLETYLCSILQWRASVYLFRVHQCYDCSEKCPLSNSFPIFDLIQWSLKSTRWLNYLRASWLLLSSCFERDAFEELVRCCSSHMRYPSPPGSLSYHICSSSCELQNDVWLVRRAPGNTNVSGDHCLWSGPVR